MPNQDFDFKKTGRFIGWCSRCAHEGVSDSGMPCGRCIPINFMEAVRFNTYCRLCKHKLNGVNDQPCYDCINKSTAYKPIKFERCLNGVFMKGDSHAKD